MAPVSTFKLIPIYIYIVNKPYIFFLKHLKINLQIRLACSVQKSSSNVIFRLSAAHVAEQLFLFVMLSDRVESRFFFFFRGSVEFCECLI